MVLKAYLAALRRSWWIVIVAAALGATAGSLVTLQSPNEYAGSVTFFAKTPSDTNSSAYQGDQFGQKRINTYIQLISSDSFASRVLAASKVDLTPAQLVSKISATGDLNTVLLTATVVDTSPERALALASTISTEFVSYVAELETPKGSKVPTIYLTVTSGPSLNPIPISPRPLLNLGLGLVAGLILGVLIALAREILDNSIRTHEDIEEITGSAILGEIPFDDKARKSPLVLGSSSGSIRSESFRRLRTNLQFVDVEAPTRVISVTSSVMGEGKSSTAANLAITLVETGIKVLLIEADLRRPRLSIYLGVEGSVGLTNVLAGQVALDDVVQPWGEGGLFILPSGSVPPNPSELLGSNTMAKVMRSLKSQFDLIIIDTPPLLAVTDAAVVSAHTDGTVVVVRHGKTSRHQLAVAMDSLKAVDARVLGLVLNMARRRRSDPYSASYATDYLDRDRLPTNFLPGREGGHHLAGEEEEVVGSSEVPEEGELDSTTNSTSDGDQESLGLGETGDLPDDSQAPSHDPENSQFIDEAPAWKRRVHRDINRDEMKIFSDPSESEPVLPDAEDGDAESSESTEFERSDVRSGR